ncbi:MAG: M12 family metallo-peptidase, partial [Candidatus Thorarchaeota archaeon]
MEIKNLYAKLKCSHIRLRILSISIILLLLLSSISVITTDVSGERTEFLLPDESNCLDTSNSRWKPDTEVLDQSEREFETARARTGAQSFAVICVHFHDLPPPANTRWTRAEIEDIMSTINDLWYNISYGKITISYQVEGWYDLGNNRAAYPNNLKDNWRGIVQEAVNLADDDINFWNFDYVLVWINQALGAPDNGFWRGVSSVGSNVLITMDDSPIPFFPFKVVGASLVGENPIESESTIWGRTAHEMGHAFGLQHTHENYNSDYSLMARAYPSDLNVYSQLVGGTEWFPTSSNEMIVEQGDQGSWVLRPRSID